jgi:ketosteroid isomerase-like protein
LSNKDRQPHPGSPAIRIHESEGTGGARGAASEADLRFLQDAYELWNSGDIEGLAEGCFSDDIEYQNSPEWPGQRVYRGSDAVARFLKEEVAEIIGLEGIKIERMDVFGDEILIALQAQAHGFQSGIDFGEVSVFHVARVRDGRVSRVRVFLDESQAIEAARAGTVDA